VGAGQSAGQFAYVSGNKQTPLPHNAAHNQSTSPNGISQYSSDPHWLLAVHGSPMFAKTGTVHIRKDTVSANNGIRSDVMVDKKKMKSEEWIMKYT
jgi:hypothetical protein